MCGHLILILWGYVPRRGIAGSYGNSVFCTARGSQTVSTVAVSSWIPPAVWEGRSQFFHVLANTCHFPIFPPKVVLSVKRCFTVADSVSPMTNDSEQSPVVLVFLLSLDPVPCPRTPPPRLQTGSQFLGGSPASPGMQPGLGIPLLAAGNAALSCSSFSGWAGPSTGTSVALQIPNCHPAGCRRSILSCHPLGGRSFCAGCTEDSVHWHRPPSPHLQGRVVAGSNMNVLVPLEDCPERPRRSLASQSQQPRFL